MTYQECIIQASRELGDDEAQQRAGIDRVRLNAAGLMPRLAQTVPAGQEQEYADKFKIMLLTLRVMPKEVVLRLRAELVEKINGGN